jgi:uncharacterized protein YqhQ
MRDASANESLHEGGPVPDRPCADEHRFHYGGQAVIEGVMMRGPDRVATAVRLPNGEIAIHTEDFVSASRRHRFLRYPVVRGGLTLIESLSLGIKALNYSASAAMDVQEDEEKDGPTEGMLQAPGGPDGAREAPDPEGAAPSEPASPSDWRTKVALTGTMVLAFGLGVLFFFWIPLVLTDFIMERTGSEGGILFNIIDGIIRVLFFLLYLWAISRWKEMRRVFEYHGAEHKTIFTQEAGEELTPENARRHTTRHPRCGTSFLLIVMIVSILVFMITGRPQNVAHRLLRLLLIPVIAGASYELMKLSARLPNRRWARMLVAPGVWLQGITTKEPTDDQIEVAIAALSAVKLEEDDVREAPIR